MHPARPPLPVARLGWHQHGVALVGLVVAVGTASAAFTPSTQAQTAVPAVVAQAAADTHAVPAKPATRPAASPPRTGKVAAGGPAWTELNPAQQQALKPLAAQWTTISEAQKRKWLALSQNYPKLPAAEQAKLHSRMTEWVALSPQQRAAARLNFADTQQLSPDDKKAKWEAYQSLSDEEKRKLAAKAAPKPAGAATAVKPVPPQKLAKVKDKSDLKDKPKIADTAPRVNHNTLLPTQQTAAPLTAPVQHN
jgi:hypothetical protein